jgi:hypothetical protein
MALVEVLRDLHLQLISCFLFVFFGNFEDDEKKALEFAASAAVVKLHSTPSLSNLSLSSS